MKKRMFSALLAAFILTGSAQAAELTAICDSQKGLVSVNLAAEDDCNGSVLIYLTDDNEEGFDLSHINGDNINQKLKAFAEAEFSDGEFKGQLIIPENIEAGWYLVTAEDYKAKDDIPVIDISERQTRIYIADTDMINAALSAVNSASVSSIDDVFEEYKDVLGIQVDEDYNSDVGKIFLAMKSGNFDTLEEVYDLFATAKATGAILRADKETMGDMLLTYGSVIGVEFSDDYEQYKDDIHALLIEAYAGITADRDAPGKVKEIFEEMTAVGVLNNSNRTQISNVLERYNNIFDLDLEGDYARCDKIEFNKALERKNFDSASAVQEAFNEKLKDLEKDSGGGGTSGSSGGGGSHRDTTTYVPTTPATPDDPQTDPTEPEPEEITFNDLESAEWAQEAIYALAEKKIVSGYSDGSFKPGNNITRNEFITMLVLAFDLLDEDAVYDFTDGDDGAWYAKYIASAKKSGILAGYEDGSFGDGQEITREDMAVFVYRLSGLESVEPQKLFADDAMISGYAKEAVYSLNAAGIINGMGDNNFAPHTRATRAQAAKIIYSVMEGDNNA